MNQQLEEKYPVLYKITGKAMEVHAEYKPGLVESAYESALKYLLTQEGYKVEQQVYLPMYWKDVLLDQHYRIDLLINGAVIVELKAVRYIQAEHRNQLWSYMRLTRQRYGMLINFGADSLYCEWYERHPYTGEINRLLQGKDAKQI